MLVLVEMVQGYDKLSSAALESVNQTPLVTTFSSLSKEVLCCTIVLGPSPVRSALLPRNCSTEGAKDACKDNQSTTA